MLPARKIEGNLLDSLLLRRVSSYSYSYSVLGILCMFLFWSSPFLYAFVTNVIIIQNIKFNLFAHFRLKFSLGTSRGAELLCWPSSMSIFGASGLLQCFPSWVLSRRANVSKIAQLGTMSGVAKFKFYEAISGPISRSVDRARLYTGL